MSDPLISPDFGGWWTRSFVLLGRAWRPMLAVQALWCVPLLALTVLGDLYLRPAVDDLRTDRDLFSATGADIDIDGIVRRFLVLVPFALLIGLIGLIVTLATLHLVVQAALNRRLSPATALRTAWRRTPAMIGHGILAALAVLGGLILCFLPGIYVSAVLTVLPAVVLLERGSGVRRCFRLVHADAGVAIARLATIGGLSFGASLVSAGVLQLIAVGFRTADLDTAGTVVAGLISLLFSVATAVVLAPMSVTAYADMRARREPFTTDHLAA